jgi:hypothetical protein
MKTKQRLKDFQSDEVQPVNKTEKFCGRKNGAEKETQSKINF